MVITAQEQIAQGHIAVDFTLEFRTWNGSAYVWTDYSDRLTGFGNISFDVEERAYPHAFRSSLNDIKVDNSDGFWTDLSTLDGLLANTSEPYGKNLYKRMLRLSEVRRDQSGNEVTTVLMVGRVRDVIFETATAEAIIKVISLDALAKDQMCDSWYANRHELGYPGPESPGDSEWTTDEPAALTDPVYIYRWRDRESDTGTYQFGWFANRRISDIIERTCWALDDLDWEIDESVLYSPITSGEGHQVASTRNVPPDDAAISTGTGDQRCRVLMWNAARGCLVVCVGHRVYDYNPVTNVYTLRNTLTSSRQIVRGWYIESDDTNGVTERIILISMDVSAHQTVQSPGSEDEIRKVQMWITVFDANGSSAYAVPTGGYNETSMGTDIWPGAYQSRVGSYDAGDGVQGIGQVNNATFVPAVSYTSGENVFIGFPQKVFVKSQAGATEYGHFQNPYNTPTGTPDIDALFTTATDGEIEVSNGEVVDRGWANGLMSVAGAVDLAFRWSWPFQRVQAAVSIYGASAKLYFFTWDSTNGYRLGEWDLFGYGGSTSYHSLPGASTDVPHCIHAEHTRADKNIRVASMTWTESGASSYSTCRYDVWDANASSWSNITWLSGATGSNQAWTIMEICGHDLATDKNPAIIWNRETLKWRFLKNVDALWSTNDTNAQTLGVEGKDSGHGLLALYENANYTSIAPNTPRVFFVMAGTTSGISGEGGALLWSWDGTSLRPENKLPISTSVGVPISTDFSVGANLVSTGLNYPDSNTPLGIMFGVTSNSYGDWADYTESVTGDEPAGEYILWQYANFFAGFIKLLDVSGLSFFDLRSALAEAYGYVHFYASDGTFKFKKRDPDSAAISFTFSAANNNYMGGGFQTQGYERILNDITVYPYEIVIEERLGDIIKVNSLSDGFVTDVSIDPDPGEVALWRIVFVSATTYDLYKLAGLGYDKSVPAVSGQSIDTDLRSPANGWYLSLFTSNFSGTFQIGDTFEFWVYPPTKRLERMDDRNKMQWLDNTTTLLTNSITDWQRSSQDGQFDNRFIDRQLAFYYGYNIADWRKDPHAVVLIEVPYDAAYQPLLQAQLTDPALGFDGSETFVIMGVRHSSNRTTSQLTLVVK